MESASPEQVFSTALEQLAQNKPADAVTHFEALLKTGFTSAAVERNFGRALIETNQLGPGIAHLTRAIALSRFDGDARNDLRVAQAKVEAGYGLPMAHPAEWGQKISSYLRASELGALGGLGLLGAMAARLYLTGSRRKKISLAALVLGLLLSAGAVFSLTSRSIAVVVADAELKQAPLESAATLSSLKSGMRVRVLRESGLFSEVERTNGFRGWLPSTALERTPY